MKKIGGLALALIILCVVLVVAVSGTVVYYMPLTSTQNSKINNLQTWLTDNETALANANSEISNLENQLSAANSNLTSLNAEITSLQSQISNLQNQLSSANSQVSSLTSQLNTANSQITSLQNQLSTDNSQLLTDSAQITNLQNWLNENITALNNANGQITSLQNQLNSANSKITSQNNIISLSDSAVIANDQTYSEAASSYATFTFSANYAGYVSVYVLSSSVAGTWIEVSYTSNGVTYNQEITTNVGYLAEFPVLPSSTITVGIGNGNIIGSATEVCTTTYYY